MQVYFSYAIISNGDKMFNEEKMKQLEEKLDRMSEKETDPFLAFDAFTAGVKDGGLRSVSAIHIIVCYIVANLGGKVTAEIIKQAMSEGMLANHFEVSDAISRLIKNGTIIEADDGALTLSDKSGASIELVEKDLPFTVRERSIHLCQKIIARETYRRENKVEIEPAGKAYTVTLHISGPETDFMKLSLYAATIEQAEMIKEKFITDPVSVYETLIEAIFANEL